MAAAIPALEGLDPDGAGVRGARCRRRPDGTTPVSQSGSPTPTCSGCWTASTGPADRHPQLRDPSCWWPGWACARSKSPRLELGDIDNWRAGEISIAGKARRRDRLPLPHDVGQALSAYLHEVRPGASAHLPLNPALLMRGKTRPAPPARSDSRPCRRSIRTLTASPRFRPPLLGPQQSLPAATGKTAEPRPPSAPPAPASPADTGSHVQRSRSSHSRESPDTPAGSCCVGSWTPECRRSHDLATDCHTHPSVK